MPPETWDWGILFWHVAQVVVYVIVGLGMFGMAYLIIDKATPFSLGKELLEKNNVAVAIVLGAVFLGIAIILSAAIRG